MPKARTKRDIERDLQVYNYLLQLCGYYDGPPPDKSKLVEMWGYRGNDKGNKFVQRLIAYLNDKQQAAPELSLTQLVEILEGIDEYFEKKDWSNSKQYPKIIQIKDKIRAIRKYCALTRDEKKRLKLPIDFTSYIQENFISDDEVLWGFQDKKIYWNNSTILEEGKDDEDKIQEKFNKIIESEIPEDWKKHKESIIDKTIDQIDSIIVQSGLENIPKISKLLPQESHSSFRPKYLEFLEMILPEELIRQLTKNIIKNTQIIQKFPIGFKGIEINKLGASSLEQTENLESKATIP